MITKCFQLKQKQREKKKKKQISCTYTPIHVRYEQKRPCNKYINAKNNGNNFQAATERVRFQPQIHSLVQPSTKIFIQYAWMNEWMNTEFLPYYHVSDLSTHTAVFTVKKKKKTPNGKTFSLYIVFIFTVFTNQRATIYISLLIFFFFFFFLFVSFACSFKR